jgi:glycerophosphoryl diester phosphodiesterase
MVRILAHRGAHQPESPDVVENTLPAFVRARDLGVDGVELDVRRTADGVLVVLHDAVLPDGSAVVNLPSSRLPPWLPTLDDALTACAGLAVVNVEIKNSPLEPGFDPGPDLARQVAAALPRRAGILVSSFHLATLDAFRAAADNVPTGWLTGPGWDQLGAVAEAAAGGHAAINPPDQAVTPELIAAAHAAGLQVCVWTVNDGARMLELAEAGVDVVITDRPALALATLRSDR